MKESKDPGTIQTHSCERQMILNQQLTTQPQTPPTNSINFTFSTTIAEKLLHTYTCPTSSLFSVIYRSLPEIKYIKLSEIESP